MGFKHGSHHIENLQDKSFIYSNANNTSNTISIGNYSYVLPHSRIPSTWPMAVDKTVIAVGGYSNVAVYSLAKLFNVFNRSNVAVSTVVPTPAELETVYLPVTSTHMDIDTDLIFIGVNDADTIPVYDKKGRLCRQISVSNNKTFKGVLKAKDGLVAARVINADATYQVEVYDYRGVNVTTLLPNSNVNSGFFGYSLDLCDGIIAVGDLGDNKGKVYVYDYAGNLKTVLHGPNVGSNFGQSVAVGFSSILVGAPGATAYGGAYVFDTAGTEIRYIDVFSTLGPYSAVGTLTAIESGKGILFGHDGYTLANHNIFSIDLRANNYTNNIFTANAVLYGGDFGLATCNGNVYVGSHRTPDGINKNIFTFSVPRRTHLLEKDI